MLQTTANQLSPEQLMKTYTRLIIEELTKAGYKDIMNKEPILKSNMYSNFISQEDSPIQMSLNLSRSSHYNTDFKQYITMVSRHGYCYNYYCDPFQTIDLKMLSKLYIHMLENNIREVPNILKSIDEKTIKPGELAEIISEYLNPED